MLHSFPGRFITVDGPDGSGKTTQVPYLKQVLQDLGYDVITTREPGGSVLGEEIRKMVLADKEILGVTETLLFLAARSDHVQKVIIPALKEGKVVISDRYMISTFAYQGLGRGLINSLHVLEQIAHNNFYPDHTLYFDVSLEVAEERLKGRTDNNRFDHEKVEFRRRVRKGYDLALESKLLPDIYQIDANQSIEQVQEQLKTWAVTLFMPSFI